MNTQLKLSPYNLFFILWLHHLLSENGGYFNPKWKKTLTWKYK